MTLSSHIVGGTEWVSSPPIPLPSRSPLASPLAPAPGIYGWSTGTGGVHYHRIGEPLRVAAQEGVNTGIGDRLDNDVLERFDTVLVHMLWDEKNSAGWEELAAGGTHRLIYDLDDAMWAHDAWAPFRKHYSTDVLRRVMRNIGLAHVVTTPSPYIAEYVAQYNPNVWLVPNSVPAAALDLPRVPHERHAGVIGYQGSTSHETDWSPPINRDLVDFLKIMPTWGLHFWGPSTREEGWPVDRVGITPWQKPGMDYYRSLNMDIGLGPTKSTLFNRGKSGLRAIEYAARGIVAVLSDHEIYRPYVEDGATGLLIKSGERWYDRLLDLAHNPIWRAGMSAEAQRRAKRWTTEDQITTWMEAWNSV